MANNRIENGYRIRGRRLPNAKGRKAKRDVLAHGKANN